MDGDYTGLGNGGTYGCLSGAAPATPEVYASPFIGATSAESGPTCTGTKSVASQGTVGGTVGGGIFVPASISGDVTVTVLTQYDFGCDYSMYANGWGEKGFLRNVHYKVSTGGGEAVPSGPPCFYDGAKDQSCVPPAAKVLSDAFTGTGIAGPASTSYPAWPLPTQVTVCPPEGADDYRRLEVWNDVAQDFGPGISAAALWTCQNFAIHYLS